MACHVIKQRLKGILCQHLSIGLKKPERKKRQSYLWSSESMASLLKTTQLLSTPHKLTYSHLHTSISFPFEISTQRNPQNQLLNLCRSSSTPSQQKASQRKRTRYRKQYPGENVGITEEMRFVAMRLRNVNGKKLDLSGDNTENEKEEEEDDDDEVKGETWKPSKEGFLKYLVDSKLVFDTIERIVDESENVSCKKNPLLWSRF